MMALVVMMTALDGCHDSIFDDWWLDININSFYVLMKAKYKNCDVKQEAIVTFSKEQAEVE